MMTIQITRPLRTDAAELHRLFATTIRDTFEREGMAISHAGDIDKEIELTIKYLKRDFDSAGKDEHFYIARDKETIVGTIAHGPANAIIREHLDIDYHITPEMKCVYVLPDYQNNGVGSLLFAYMLKVLLENGVEEFCLDSGYVKAQGFWEKRLGQPKIILKNRYGEGLHHMIWRCRLTDIE